MEYTKERSRFFPKSESIFNAAKSALEMSAIAAKDYKNLPGVLIGGLLIVGCLLGYPFGLIADLALIPTKIGK